MKLVSIKYEYLKEYTEDKEMLQKSKRPCALIVRMKYKGRHYDFAVPIRSNIPDCTPRDLYYSLPTRSTTKPKHHHGLHYSKMFPIKREWLSPFRTDTIYSAMIKAFIDKNEKQIIIDCQSYLNRYEAGDIPQFATNIDFLIETMQRL